MNYCVFIVDRCSFVAGYCVLLCVCCVRVCCGKGGRGCMEDLPEAAVTSPRLSKLFVCLYVVCGCVYVL